MPGGARLTLGGVLMLRLRPEATKDRTTCTRCILDHAFKQTQLAETGSARLLIG